MILVVPIEVKIREFLPKLFLVIYLLKKYKGKIKIIFGSQRDILSKLDLYNCIYLDKGSGTIVLSTLKKLKKKGNNILQIDEEGPICAMNKFEKVYRYPKEIYNIVDTFLAWGKEDYLFFRKKKNKNKIHITGHPKFDLLEKKNINIFQSQVKKIKNKYNNFILYASSFSNDGILDDRISRKYINSYLPKKKDLIKNDEYIAEERSKDYIFVINILKKLANENKHLKIIFRPHPVQDIKKVKKRFIDNNNIIVTKDYTITPWIYAAKLYLHSGCTTSFEACKLKKKTFIIVRNFKNKKNIIFKYGFKINNFKMLNFYIKNLKRNNKKNIFKDEIFNIKLFNIFSKKFLEIIQKYNLLNSKYSVKKIPKNNLRNIVYKFLSKIKNINFISIILPYFFQGNILLTKDYKEQKFKKISISELKKNILKINQSLKSDPKINIKKIADNVFILQKKV